MAGVQLGNKWGFIDKTGKEVVEKKYDDIDPFFEGMAVVKIKDKDGSGDKEGYIDNTGKEVVEPKYDFAAFFEDGMGEVTNYEMGIMVGYVDKTGQEVVEVKYNGVSKIRNNTIVLVKDDKVGLLTIK